jgi:hypothetical protein
MEWDQLPFYTATGIVLSRPRFRPRGADDPRLWADKFRFSSGRMIPAAVF